ncbi:hypothetical protein [Bradyrhizobium guangxiense]|uniref:hypothetical protein n=1 Tax=Bradyrhizobium guangxiense TaxID=1325115 RepID=UPI0013E8CFC5|nr:hypothetical protein [Bradyrhizobium guangxiense]
MARATRVPYLVSGTNEYGSANLGRGSATVALRLGRKLLRDGYMDVRVCTPRGRVLQADELGELEPQESDMAKGQQRGNREAKKPKKDKAKVIAAAPSRKEAAWQPNFGPAKKK